MAIINKLKKGLASLLAIPILSLGCREIPNQDFKLQKEQSCLTVPQISNISNQNILMGDSISIPVDIQNLSNDDKVYLNGPAGMSLNNTENGLEIKWKPCGDSAQNYTTQATIEAENKCKEGSSKTFNVNVIPRNEPLYLKQFSQDVNLQIGDTARIPVLASEKQLDISISNNPVWATLDNKELFLSPYTAYDDSINVNVTDNCYTETEKVKLNVSPITIDGSLYDYFKKLNIRDLNNPEDKEDWYYLRRQVGYGLTDQELDNKIDKLENMISANYTITKSHSTQNYRPIYIELKKSEKCLSLGYESYFKPGLICITNINNIEENVSHEDIHARLYGKIPNTGVLGGNGLVQEPFSYAIGALVSNNLESFSDLIDSYKKYDAKFINDLNLKYNFDVQNLINFFSLLDQKTNNGRDVLPLQRYKCVLDTFFKDNTFDVYCNNFTCSDDPKYFGIYDIPPEYCGD